MNWYDWIFLGAIGLVWIEHFMDWVERIVLKVTNKEDQN